MESKTYCGSSSRTPLVRLDFSPDTRIWILYFLGQHTHDNRLTHEFIRDGLVAALRDVRKTWDSWVEQDEAEGGAARVTTALPESKIYSTGLDLFSALSDPLFFNDYLNVLFRELLTFPIPTIAAIGGHAFAGGCTVAFSHDYRVQNAHRGYICMNEIEFGAPIPQGMMGAIRSVVASPLTLRKLVLEGHRFSAQEAKEHGLVDMLAEGGAAGTIQTAVELAKKLRSRCARNAWQVNKEIIYENVLRSMYEPRRSKLHL